MPERPCCIFLCLSLEVMCITHISLAEIDAMGFPNGKGLRIAVFLCTQEEEKVWSTRM